MLRTLTITQLNIYLTCYASLNSWNGKDYEVGLIMIVYRNLEKTRKTK